jgi:competence protein ComGC
MGKFTILEQLVVSLVMSMLQLVIKNPASVKQESSVIHQIAELATQADNQVNLGSSWSFTPAPAPAAAKKP